MSSCSRFCHDNEHHYDVLSIYIIFYLKNLRYIILKLFYEHVYIRRVNSMIDITNKILLFNIYINIC